jgi:hypothetical protein
MATNRSWQRPERRRETRHHIHVNVQLQGLEEGFALARDINSGGMRIETEGLLPAAGKTCQVRFRLWPGYTLLAARTRVLWARRVAPGLTQAGLRFVELPLATQSAISRFMQTNPVEAA